MCGGLCTEEGCETGWEGGQRSPLSSLRATPPHPRTHPNSPTLQTPNPSLQTPTPHKQVVDSKQLQPLVRTQYMRTAFQIPFDATVRVSLDTNLGARCRRWLLLTGRLACWPLRAAGVEEGRWGAAACP